MSDATPNLTGATFLSAATLAAVTQAKARIAAAQKRITDATTRHAAASGQMEGIAAVLEQEAANLEASVHEMLPGSNSAAAQ
jgi:exonuclease VII small subunit